MKVNKQTVGSVQIRPAEPGDIDALLMIENSCFFTDRTSRRQMRYLLTKAKAYRLVAQVNGNVVGYGISLTPALPRPARLYSLAVLPTCRGMGIANALMLAMKTALEQVNYRYWRLEVDEANRDARRLYENWGFESIAHLPSYYENGSHGLRMQCALIPAQRNKHVYATTIHPVGAG